MVYPFPPHNFFFYGKIYAYHSSETELQQRVELQEQLQSTFLNNKMLYKAWDDTFPNLRDTWHLSCFGKIMGNSIAISFQMLE